MSIDMRTIVEWDDTLEISATDQTLSFTWSGADVSGTWTGTVRDTLGGTDQALTVTVGDTYSSPDTALTVQLTGSELAALIPSGERSWSGWLGFSRAESPIKGLQGPVKVHQVVN